MGQINLGRVVGPQGIQGIKGEQGDSGAGNSFYLTTSLINKDTETININSIETVGGRNLLYGDVIFSTNPASFGNIARIYLFDKAYNTTKYSINFSTDINLLADQYDNINRGIKDKDTVYFNSANTASSYGGFKIRLKDSQILQAGIKYSFDFQVNLIRASTALPHKIYMRYGETHLIDKVPVGIKMPVSFQNILSDGSPDLFFFFGSASADVHFEVSNLIIKKHIEMPDTLYINYKGGISG